VSGPLNPLHLRPNLLEWYQEIFKQVQDFSLFLRNPRLLSSGLANNSALPNLFETTFVRPTPSSSTRNETSSLYTQGDPPLRSIPENNYSAERASLYAYYTSELEALQKDPLSLGFDPDEELGRLLYEGERDKLNLPGIYRNVTEAVDVVGERLAKAKGIVKGLESNFDWKLRLGEIYASDDDEEEDEDEDEDGSGDADGSDEEVQVVAAPSPSTAIPSSAVPTISSFTSASATSSAGSSLRTPALPSAQEPEIRIVPNPASQPQPQPQPASRPQAQTQGTSSAAPINLDLSDDDDDEDMEMNPVPVPALNPTAIPGNSVSTSNAPSPAVSIHSSPLFGTEDGTGTAQGSPDVLAEGGQAGIGVALGSAGQQDDDDEDEDMEEVDA